MKQPTDHEERNDKKKPENENPSHGIDPEPKEPEMEVEQGDSQKENQNQKKDDSLAAYFLHPSVARGPYRHETRTITSLNMNSLE